MIHLSELGLTLNPMNDIATRTPDGYVTLQQIRDRTGLSPLHLRRLIDSGDCPTVTMHGQTLVREPVAALVSEAADRHRADILRRFAEAPTVREELRQAIFAHYPSRADSSKQP